MTWRMWSPRFARQRAAGPGRSGCFCVRCIFVGVFVRVWHLLCLLCCKFCVDSGNCKELLLARSVRAWNIWDSLKPTLYLERVRFRHTFVEAVFGFDRNSETAFVSVSGCCCSDACWYSNAISGKTADCTSAAEGGCIPYTRGGSVGIRSVLRTW